VHRQSCPTFRGSVDDRFIEALKADKQIVVYGSSKQGKTALVQRYLPYEENIVVRLTPKTQIGDIYASLLRQLGIQIKESVSDSTGRESSVGIKVAFKALIPIFGGAEASTQGKLQTTAETGIQYKEIPFNLELPQDVSELIRECGFDKSIILENFHYLDEDRQKQLAFDLRTFQELGIRFIILGVWREKNRLAQFNGDLVDRIIEVPVEPWRAEDFRNVIAQGSEQLNVLFTEDLVARALNSSFSSIGVFQELLKEMCANAGVLERGREQRQIDNLDYFTQAVTKKAQDYSSRHERSLEAIAAGNVSSSGRGDVLPLFLPYYLVRVVLDGGYEGLENGMRRATIQERIQAIHHRPNDVRASDMSNLLYNLASLQAAKSISPPIIDYDQSTKLLQVVDSTFYFFLKNADLKSIADELMDPVADAATRIGSQQMNLQVQRN
jgi:hypothetical protein